MRDSFPSIIRPWLRFVYIHNPFYLLSAWFVLHGMGLLIHAEPGQENELVITPLMCGYIFALASAGWLVVRLGKVWQDARMILLVLLLMFTGLSVSYDELCLRDPLIGSIHLVIGFSFSCAITEGLLRSLSIKLPSHYRLPFYLQLAVLFAFPAWLGSLSATGRDMQMLAGVLIFPLIAGASLLALIPAARSSPTNDNGTPWPWPFYPWSIFVFIVMCFVIRAWMLSLSFSPAYGVDPAFLPYFLCPILLAALVLLLELGLCHQSNRLQWMSLLGMLGVILVSFPGTELNRAQQLLLGLLQTKLAGPPLLVTIAVIIVGVYALLRRAAGAEFLTLMALTIAGSLMPRTEAINEVGFPNVLFLTALASWLFGSGIWARSTIRLAAAGISLILIANTSVVSLVQYEPSNYWMILFGISWVLLLPLWCRDSLGRWLRDASPVLISLGVLVAPFVHAFKFSNLPVWQIALPATLLVGFAMLYWAVWKKPSLVAAAAGASFVAVLYWSGSVIESIPNAQMQRGIAWYFVGCWLLVASLAFSLWKAGIVHKLWLRLQQTTSKPDTEETPLT